MRILGNLSRSRITRNYISESEIFTVLLSTLNKGIVASFHVRRNITIAFVDDIVLLRTTAGVFVNLMADEKNRVTLRNQGGIFKLVNILNNFGQIDWSLAMLVCQVIWNYCIDTTNLYELITDEEIQQLMAILIDYLGKKLFLIVNFA